MFPRTTREETQEKMLKMLLFVITCRYVTYLTKYNHQPRGWTSFENRLVLLNDTHLSCFCCVMAVSWHLQYLKTTGKGKWSFSLLPRWQRQPIYPHIKCPHTAHMHTRTTHTFTAGPEADLWGNYSSFREMNTSSPTVSWGYWLVKLHGWGVCVCVCVCSCMFVWLWWWRFQIMGILLMGPCTNCMHQPAYLNQ